VQKRTSQLVRQFEKLKVTESNLELIIDGMPDGILILDMGGSILFSNPAAQGLLEQGKAKLRGQIIGLPSGKDIIEVDVLSADGDSRAVEIRTVDIRWEDTPCQMAILSDVTERREAESRIRALSRRLLDVQEKERREMGHALHDEVGGSLTILRLALEKARPMHGSDVPPGLEDVQQIVDELSDQIRYISHTMRPSMLDDYGLLDALHWYFERFEDRTGIKVNFSHNMPDGRLPVRIETTAYRIVQETLTNAARHSGTKNIDMTLYYGQCVLSLSIDDRGCGFDPEEIAAGIGITGMQDIAELAGGTLTVSSSPGEGTSIQCEIPVGPQV
jgi:signal transduction histidine kinase